MRAFSVGSYPHLAQPQAPPAGELVAATPLGKDENGKNLVAYIVRTEEETSFPPGLRRDALNNANSNNPEAKKAPKQARQETTARFIKPDALLSQVEQEQLKQLRARDADVREDAAALADDKSILTSFVYDKGPDGQRYAVGVATPLMTQKAGIKETPSLPKGQLNPYIQAAIAYRHSSAQDALGSRAGLLDRAL